MQFACPFLRGEVELSAERETHILGRHPDLEGKLEQWIAETLAAPDKVIRSTKSNDCHKFVRRVTDEVGGRHMIVVVVSEQGRERHWVITAYRAKRLSPRSVIEWNKE